MAKSSADLQLQRWAYTALLLVLVTVILIYTRSLFVPFTIALFVYSILAVMIRTLSKKLKIKRSVATLLSLTLVNLVGVVVCVLVVYSLQDFFESASEYRKRVLDLVEVGTRNTSILGFDLSSLDIKNELKQLPFLGWARGITGGALHILGNAFLVFIFLLFFIAGGNKEIEGKRHSILKIIDTQVSQYILMKSGISLLTGVFIFTVFSFFRVDLALMFSVITVLLNFIPSIGSLIAVALPLPVIYLQFGFSVKFFAVLMISALIQFLIGNVLEPKMMGDSMRLHPVIVLLFLIFWGLVWGIPGMFLSVPIMAVLKIILSQNEATQGYAQILSGELPERT